MKTSFFKFCLTTVLSLTQISFLSIASDDEVIEFVNEGLVQYKNGEYSAAAGSFEYAVQMIRQKKGGQLQSFLPEPLSGWTAKESTSQAASAALFGGGVTAERSYTKETSSVTVSVVTDSPILQSMMMINQSNDHLLQWRKIRENSGSKGHG